MVFLFENIANTLLQAEGCVMLNTDGKLLEIDEKYGMNYSDVADQNVTMKFQFWRRYLNIGDSRGACGAVCIIVGLVRITLHFFTISNFEILLK